MTGLDGLALLGGAAVVLALIYWAQPCALKHQWRGWGNWYRSRVRGQKLTMERRYRYCAKCGASQRQERKL
jgi:hypothetical protein